MNAYFEKFIPGTFLARESKEHLPMSRNGWFRFLDATIYYFCETRTERSVEV
jgi:hypothetical protein